MASIGLKDVVGPAIGAGLGMVGSAVANRGTNKQNEWQRQLQEAEIKRRNMMQGFAAPSMLRGLGYSTGRIPGMAAQIGGQPSPQTSQSANRMVPSTPSSTGSKVLGGIGAGAGAASLLGLSGLAGPIGLAAGGLGLAASQIGKGRRTANQFVQGVQNPFDQSLGNIQSKEDLDKALNDYLATNRSWQTQGGNQGKVASQALANPQFRQTIQSLYQKFGGVAPEF